MKHRAFFNWSGGKDSALALYTAQEDGMPVEALVTSINKSAERVSMHGVRRELAARQAAAIGLPLHTIEVPEMPGMQVYEAAVQKKHRQLKRKGFTHGIFGDIFLEDLRAYRENLLAKDGLECLFPIWKWDTKQIIQQFEELGFKAIIVCVNSAYLDQSCCGKLLDASFITNLPPGVDPCGENGEYHSFVFDGPLFSQPISFTKGEVVFKEYAAPTLPPPQSGLAKTEDDSDECFTKPQPPAGFYFQDLIPV
jgi:uncharacterized protein (TIGR00290 family)